MEGCLCQLSFLTKIYMKGELGNNVHVGLGYSTSSLAVDHFTMILKYPTATTALVARTLGQRLIALLILMN